MNDSSYVIQAFIPLYGIIHVIIHVLLDVEKYFFFLHYVQPSIFWKNSYFINLGTDQNLWLRGDGKNDRWLLLPLKMSIQFKYPLKIIDRILIT